MINASVYWEAIQWPEGDKGEGLGDNNSHRANSSSGKTLPSGNHEEGEKGS